jgi:hypothetical protein
MIILEFNTGEHTLDVVFEDHTEFYDNVMTIKYFDAFYEVLQKQPNGKNAPLFRTPINSTIIKYTHAGE